MMNTQAGTGGADTGFETLLRRRLPALPARLRDRPGQRGLSVSRLIAFSW
jgi:hypothetical protein